jgi:hypothetical protein
MKQVKDYGITNIAEIAKRNGEFASLVRLNRIPEISKKLKDTYMGLTDLVFLFYREKLNSTEFDMIYEAVMRIGYYSNIPDFKLFCEYCKDGRYKTRPETVDGVTVAVKFYKLTPDVFIEWFKCYLLDRGEEFVRLNSVANKVNKSQPFESIEVFEKLSEIFKSKETVQIEKPKDWTVILVDKLRSEYHDKKTINNVPIENLLHKKSYLEAESVEYAGKFLGLNEYVAARFEDFYNDVTAEWSQIEGEKISLVEYINEKIRDYESK